MRVKALLCLLMVMAALCCRGQVLASQEKVVFISDLHMNLDQPYSWLRDHIDDVASFLNETNARQDVDQLVILGDMLDEWVYPMSDVAGPAFRDILNTGINQPIVSALQAVCANPAIEVSYVAGNHDMLSFEEANKQIISEFFPQMNIISEEPGLGYLSWDDVILAEHGHRYCLFNAPDTWSHSGSHLPLGYFISRAVADRSGDDGAPLHYPDVLAQYIAQNGLVDELPQLVYEAVALYTGHTLSDSCYMNGFDSFSSDPLVREIGSIYSEIMAKWDLRQNTVSKVMAVIDDMGTLLGAALHQFQNPTDIPFTPKIIIFGHTHNAAFHDFSYPEDHIYVNTGTWIDKKPCTYVEVTMEQLALEKTYDVALWYYGDSAPHRQGTVSIANN